MVRKKGDKYMLKADQLTNRHNPDDFLVPFSGVKDLDAVVGLINQERAIEGLELGLRRKGKRFNIRVVLSDTTSRATAVIKEVEDIMRKDYNGEKLDVFDTCEVDTSTPTGHRRNPRSFFVPAGEGKALQEDMLEFFEDLRRESLDAFRDTEFSEENKRFQKERVRVAEAQDAETRELADKHGVRLIRFKVNNSSFHVLPRIDSKYIKRDQISPEDGVAVVVKDPSGEIVFQDTGKQVDFSKMSLEKYTILLAAPSVPVARPEYWLLGEDGEQIFKLYAFQIQGHGIIWVVPPENYAQWVKYIKDLEEKENALLDEENTYFCVQNIPPVGQHDPPRFWVLDDEGKRSFEIISVHDQETMTAADYWRTPPNYRKEAFEYMGIEGEALDNLMDDIREFEIPMRQELSDVMEETKEGYEDLCKETMGKVFDHLAEYYHGKYPTAKKYFDDLRQYAVDIYGAFQNQPLDQPFAAQVGQNQFIDLSVPFSVNVLVSNVDLKNPVPIVYENNPSFDRLFGEVARPMTGMGQGGMRMYQPADHMSFKAGSLLKANGGVLIMPITMEWIMGDPYWLIALTSLIKSVKDEKVKVEDLPTHFNVYSDGLDQEEIPLDVRVVLVVDSHMDGVLSQLPGYHGFFQSKAQLLSYTERTPENELLIARMLGNMIRNSEDPDALDCSREAASVVIGYASRLADHQEKLSNRFDDMKHLLNEADYWAHERARDSGTDADIIKPQDVLTALDHRVYRADAIAQRMREMMREGVLKVDVSGGRVGRMNALAVYGAEGQDSDKFVFDGLGEYSMDGFAFGRPTVVSAAVSPGKFNVVNVERVIEMAGPSQQKSVLILSGYFKRKYGPKLGPLALDAQIAFEQNYGGIDGDSASLVEFIVMISDLIGIAILQNIAMTGSMNQHGDAQAIGGANYKIEGFHDVCKLMGDGELSGDQMVVIPKDNVKHLMLRHDVVEAVRKGKFHIAAVSTVDEALELAMGKPASEINKLVEEKLQEYLDLIKNSSSTQDDKDSK